MSSTGTFAPENCWLIKSKSKRQTPNLTDRIKNFTMSESNKNGSREQPGISIAVN